MKKSVGKIFFIFLASVFLVSFVSAGWWSNFFGNSVTGNAIVQNPYLEQQLRGPASYDNASADCDARGMRLPTWQEASWDLNNQVLEGANRSIRLWTSDYCYSGRYAGAYYGLRQVVESGEDVNARYYSNNCLGATVSAVYQCLAMNVTQPATCTSFNYSDWSACNVTTGKQTRYILSSSPAGCTGGNPVLNQSCTVVCADSDGGLNYYVKGYMNVTSCSAGVCGSTTDYDLCGSTPEQPDSYVSEKYCDSTKIHGIGVIDYTCSNGCSNGACVNSASPWTLAKPNISCLDSYALRVGIYNNKTFFQQSSECSGLDGCHEELGYASHNFSSGDIISLGNIVMRVGDISLKTHNIGNISFYLESENSTFEYTYDENMGYFRDTNSTFLKFVKSDSEPRDTVLVASYCGSSNQVCQSLINNPILLQQVGDYVLYNNYTSHGDWDKFSGPATLTELGYSLSTDNSGYGHLFVGVVVLDNTSLSIADSQWLEEFKRYNRWEGSSTGENQMYYVIREKQGNYEQGYNFWYNKNVLVIIGKDYRVSNSGSIASVEDFIASLKDNQYSAVSSFDIGSEIMELTNAYMASCPPTVKEDCWPIWQYKIEPVVCPEYGYQTEKWIDSNCNNNVVEQQRSCNPGICSGCLTPRWFDDKWNNKCIPYGFRLETEVIAKEISIDFIDSDSASLIVNNERTSNLSIGESYGLSDGSNLTLMEIWNYTKPGASNQYSAAIMIDGYWLYVQEGSTSNIPKSIDAYCEINGYLNQQKGDDSECQNDYECYSNECNTGQCVNSYVKTVQNTGMLAKIFCYLSEGIPLFGGSEDGYQQCLLAASNN